ncbi:MAG: FadR family transcriptional regulator [Defluviimonas sp.]|uniref:FadR/GntR family transcriptional regulator n=1 Tax=Albidovulum sp. TaxID=1872424 RepID=UPI001DCD68C2|nr:FadR family transcriptional regulator [Paracoccaceae bacterium]MCC0063727.1 FadR family transcriptional regulator [Defluviimonas sp.]
MPPATSRTKRAAPRTAQVAEHLKAYIVERGLRPGDRLPGEAELIAALGKSKGTVREAMRILGAQGLIRTRTGPGGGVFVADVSADHAVSLLANFFYFRDLSIDDLYQLRILLEPELAASVAGRIPPETMERFRAETTRFDSPPATAEEEREQHVASLAFHRDLAELCPNPLLAFVVGFIAKTLSDLTVFRRLYEPRNLELWAMGHDYHARLLDALERGDADSARAIMRDHMQAALRLMRDQEVKVAKRFLA